MSCPWPLSRCFCEALTAICNRFRLIHEWSELPRQLAAGAWLNFAFNPNVAPTELVPIFVARFNEPPEPIIARFGINMTPTSAPPECPHGRHEARAIPHTSEGAALRDPGAGLLRMARG